jgi:hypothetical protein
MSMSSLTLNEPGYALFVRPKAGRWNWTVMTLDAEVAARGQCEDRDSAWRNGEVAAATLGALRRAARRRGF